jgi:histidine triad (HIT) family protein
MPATVLRDYGDALVIAPLTPVTDGHALVFLRRHVADAAEDPHATGDVMEVASSYIREHDIGACNLITSVGAQATQTVFHMHVHVVPRREGDGLRLPWSEVA